MTLQQFHNAMRTILNIDMHELVDAGIIEKNALSEYHKYARDPFMWFIRAPSGKQEKLWQIIERHNRPLVRTSASAG